MKKLKGRQVKWLKGIHILAAGIWVTTGIVMLSFVFFMPEKISTGPQLYISNYILYFIDVYILPPAAILCLLTGLIYSAFTGWGFFKHKWISVKWVITISVILLGMFVSEPLIQEMVVLSKDKGLGALHSQQYVQTRLHQNALGVLMLSSLVFAIFVSVLKPWKKRKVKKPGDKTKRFIS